MQYIAVGATVQFMLTTNAAAGNRVAPSSAFAAADFEIYKDGSTARGNTTGYTVTSPVNSKTGLHNIAIDTSDNTVAGFFAAGHKYSVHLYPATTTVDSQAPGALVGEFIIGPVDANLIQILGTALTETAGQIAAAFKKWFNVATPTGTVNSIPDAVAGAANGLLIAGTNAPVTISGSGDALTLTSTGGNGAGLNASGNGSGAGIKATGGATGHGLNPVGGATSGDGIRASTPVSGHGLTLIGAGIGHGLNAQGGGGATGNGITAQSNASNGNGMALVKTGTGHNLDSTTENEITANIGNTVNTGANFNVNNSVFKQIRQASGNTQVAIRTGTAQAGSTSNTIKLDSGASSINDIYNEAIIWLTGGTGAGQQRTIIAYNGATKIATVDQNWVVTPDGTSTFEIDASAGSIVANEGTAQGGGAATITLASTASTADHIYENSFVSILSGTGSGQTRIITGYVGSSRVATVDSAWSVQPDNTSAYVVIPSAKNAPSVTFNAPSVAQIAAGILVTPGNLIYTDANGHVRTTYPITKNVALAAFPIQMVLASDHISPATGKTVTVQRSIDGGAFANCATATATEVGNGLYAENLANTDLNGTTVQLRATAPGCDPFLVTLIPQA